MASSPLGSKRLTLDLPRDMHRALKMGAAEHDIQMADLLRCLVGELLSDPKRLEAVAERARQNKMTPEGR